MKKMVVENVYKIAPVSTRKKRIQEFCKLPYNHSTDMRASVNKCHNPLTKYKIGVLEM